MEKEKIIRGNVIFDAWTAYLYVHNPKVSGISDHLIFMIEHQEKSTEHWISFSVGLAIQLAMLAHYVFLVLKDAGLI